MRVKYSIEYPTLFAINQPLIMKKDLHPKLNKIKVQMTDGSEFETLSTWGSDGEVMKLEIDPKSHPAWTGESQKAQDKGRVSKFNKRFANLKKN